MTISFPCFPWGRAPGDSVRDPFALIDEHRRNSSRWASSFTNSHGSGAVAPVVAPDRTSTAHRPHIDRASTVHRPHIGHTSALPRAASLTAQPIPGSWRVLVRPTRPGQARLAGCCASNLLSARGPLLACRRSSLF